MLDSRTLPSFHKDLLAWYKAHQRPLPWRTQNPNPYHVWLAEIVFQQTRIAQGLPYYLRFLEAYPTVQSLSSATEQEVLRMWQGLGYYSRARNLRKGARMIARNFGGRFPQDVNTLQTIPGVGAYTAGAISSIAFGHPVAIVDGNVVRVLSRILNISEPYNTNSGIARFKEASTEVLNLHSPGDHNQALMEHGALICLPRTPLCMQCPVSSYCEAFKLGIQETLPKKVGKAPSKLRTFHYFEISNSKGVILKEREEGDIWQGLWEMPLFESSPPQKEGDVPIVKLPPLIKSLRAKGDVTSPKARLKHILTHQKIEVLIYGFTLPRGIPQVAEPYHFIPWADLEKYPMPKPIVTWFEARLTGLGL